MVHAGLRELAHQRLAREKLGQKLQATELVRISPATAKRHRVAAHAWLFRAMEGAGRQSPS